MRNPLTKDLNKPDTFTPKTDDRMSFADLLGMTKVNGDAVDNAIEGWRNNPPIDEFQNILEPTDNG